MSKKSVLWPQLSTRKLPQITCSDDLELVLWPRPRIDSNPVYRPISGKNATEWLFDSKMTSHDQKISFMTWNFYSPQNWLPKCSSRSKWYEMSFRLDNDLKWPFMAKKKQLFDLNFFVSELTEIRCLFRSKMNEMSFRPENDLSCQKLVLRPQFLIRPKKCYEMNWKWP